MKHTLCKLTAIAATAITLLSAVSIPASAYNVTYSNYRNLTNNFNGAGSGYCWGTEEQQNAFPRFNASFLNSLPAVYTKISGRNYGDTTIFCTLDQSVISKDILKDPAKALNARKQIDKIFAEDQNGWHYGLKMHYMPQGNNPNLSSFALQLLSEYNMNYEFYDEMYLDEDSFTFDYTTCQYSGRLCFDELYVAGMRISSSDRFTTFSEPVIEWTGHEPSVYVEFSGQIPNPQIPVFEGVYDKLMTRSLFNVYFNFLRPNGVIVSEFEFDEVPILTDLTVTYNCDGQAKYQTDDFEMSIEVPYLTCCD